MTPTVLGRLYLLVYFWEEDSGGIFKDAPIGDKDSTERLYLTEGLVKKTSKLHNEPGIVAHAFDPSTSRQRQERL